MLALYRSGRHADSLRVYSDTRERLIDELGIEPSDTLADLELRILSNDVSLAPTAVTLAFPEHAVRGYQLVQRVKESAVDEIYLAYQPSVGRQVAIRMIGSELATDPEFMERYWSDAAALARVNHPNIVYVQDTWLDQGKVFEVMAWIDGQRLDHYLSSGPVHPAAAWRIFEQVAGAAKAANEAGVTHGAISTESVIVTRGGNAYLKDFIGWRQTSVTEDRVALANLATELLAGVRPSATFDPAIASLGAAAATHLTRS
jgi:serine/threonine protein kinase